MTRTPFEIDENESDSIREEMKRDKLKKKLCPRCDGDGKIRGTFEKLYICPTCNGSGEVDDKE